MSTILTCTDGSIYAPSVYEHASWAAARTGAAVHLLHTIDPHKETASLADLSGSLTLDAQERLMHELAELDEARARVSLIKGRAILDEAKRHLTENGITDVQLEQRHGTLVDAIEEIESAFDMIVIGKRGKSADFAKLHIGGNLQKVIRASHRPVLVASRKFNPIKTFLVAFDGGDSSRKAIEFAVSSPLLRGLKCHLVMAAGTVTPEFASARAAIEAAGFEIEYKVNPGHPEEVIAEAVKKDHADLLVMGAYGHSRIRQLILGSTTTAMIRTCPVPVLVFR